MAFDEGSVAGTAHFGVADYSLGAVYHESRGETFPRRNDENTLFDYNDGEYHFMPLNGMLKKSAGSLMVNIFIH